MAKKKSNKFKIVVCCALALIIIALVFMYIKMPKRYCSITEETEVIILKEHCLDGPGGFIGCYTDSKRRDIQGKYDYLCEAGIEVDEIKWTWPSNNEDSIWFNGEGTCILKTYTKVCEVK